MKLKRRFRMRSFELGTRAPLPNLPKRTNKVNARGVIRLRFEDVILKFFLLNFIDSSKRLKQVLLRLTFFGFGRI